MDDKLNKMDEEQIKEEIDGIINRIDYILSKVESVRKEHNETIENDDIEKRNKV